MNLTKLFNLKFLKQNLKKSKGQLILFLSIVPIFTFLTLMMSLTDSQGEVYTTANISIINILGMYVIPVILSINLFGYVYKRKSVDFINSMPINKETIFVSNTIGGVFLIVLMQIINMFGLFIIKSMFAESIILTSVIWDSFIIMTISYIFVFTATNIAMSLAGNILTQIVITLLILFLIPFTVSSFNNTFFEKQIEYSLIENGNPIGIIRVKDEINETTPYRIIRLIFTNSFDQFYNAKSLGRTGFLSIAYIIIGILTFKNRKFENAEQSFENMYVHFFVKALTIFPMIMLLCLFNYWEAGIAIVLFCLALIIAYYFIYDVITSKKIKFVPSAINLIITLLLLHGISYGITIYAEEPILNKINKEDIVGISMNIGRKSDGGYSNSKIMDYYLENKDYIEYTYLSNADDALYFSSRYTQYPVNIKMKNGKIYHTYLNIKTNFDSRENIFNELILKLSEDYKYVELYKQQFKTEGEYLFEDFVMDENAKEILNKEFNEYVDNSTLSELWNASSNSEIISKYNYSNHRLMIAEIPIDFSEAAFNEIVRCVNTKSKKIAEEKIQNNEFNTIYIANRYEKNRKYINTDEKVRDILKNIVEDENTASVNIDDNYFIVYSYRYSSNRKIMYFTTNENIKNIYYNTIQGYEEHDYELYKYNVSPTTEIVEVNVVTNEIENPNTVNNNVINNEIN